MFKKKRKVRSDKIYRTRKKNGKMLPYYSKRDKNDPLKLWFFEMIDKTKESYSRIPRKARPTIFKKNFHPSIRVDVPGDLISTPQKVIDLTIEVMGRPGLFQMRMFGHSKNKHHVSAYKRAKIKLFETENGLRGNMIEINNLHRYFFWRGGKNKI